MMKIIFFVGALLCFTCFRPSQPALTAFDCTNDFQDFGFSDEDIFPVCESISTSRTIRGKLIQQSPLKKVKAHRCLVTFTQWVIDSRGTRRVTLVNESQTIGKEACLKAHSTKKVVLLGHRIPFLDAKGTIEHTVTNIKPFDIEDDSREECHRGYHYERTYRITLSRQHGDIDFKRDVVKFGGIACDYSHLNCEDGELGELYWKSERVGPPTVFYCGDIQLVTKNESKTTEEVTYAVLPNNGMAFVLKTRWNETSSGIREFYTEFDDVFIVEEPGIPRFFGKFAEGKFSGVYSEATGFERYDAVEVVKRLCKTERTEFFRSIELLNGSVVQLQRRGLMALQMTPGSYTVKRCIEKKVNLRETNECFEDIPVSDEDRGDCFLNPFSRILNTFSQPIDCPGLVHGKGSEPELQDWVKILNLQVTNS